MGAEHQRRDLPGDEMGHKGVLDDCGPRLPFEGYDSLADKMDACLMRWSIVFCSIARLQMF
jgi:hypothetical protein